jgi:hypothetical protein
MNSAIKSFGKCLLLLGWPPVGPAFRGTVPKTYVKSRVPHFARNVSQISFFSLIYIVSSTSRSPKWVSPSKYSNQNFVFVSQNLWFDKIKSVGWTVLIIKFWATYFSLFLPYVIPIGFKNYHQHFVSENVQEILCSQNSETWFHTDKAKGTITDLCSMYINPSFFCRKTEYHELTGGLHFLLII